MSRSAQFLPPLPNPLLLRTAKAALPFLFRHQAGGIEVDIPEADLATLRALKGQRVLLLPNHPTHFDPMVMIELSNRLDEDFYFVAAREVFDKTRTWGWLLQHLGCYSLVRGAVDRDSFAMTQKILAGEHTKSKNKNWLVIFIEGEVSLENDSHLPFEAGVVSLALRTQDKLPANATPLHALTVAMRTAYKPGVEHAIADSISALETAVGLPPKNQFIDWPTTRARLGSVGCALLESVERTYLISPKPADTLDSRITALKIRLLSKMEAHLDLVAPKDAPILERVRLVRNRMDRIIHTYGDDTEKISAYDRRLLDLRRQTFSEFYADLARLVNFLTFRGDYLNNASPERFAEVTIRLEKEIFGHPILLHPRTVNIRIGRPHNLADSLPAFREDKRQTATTLTETLESEMTALLQSMKPGSPALPLYSGI